MGRQEGWIASVDERIDGKDVVVQAMPRVGGKVSGAVGSAHRREIDRV